MRICLRAVGLHYVIARTEIIHNLLAGHGVVAEYALELWVCTRSLLELKSFIISLLDGVAYCFQPNKHAVSITFFSQFYTLF